MDQAAMRQAFVCLGCTDNEAQAITDEQEINSLEELWF